jgi:hypothetical protein
MADVNAGFGTAQLGGEKHSTAGEKAFFRIFLITHKSRRDGRAARVA